MDNVTYRKIESNDYNSAKNLIGEAFGINKLIDNEKLLDNVLNIYLQDCIIDSTFSNVALKDGKVIGFILGKSNNDKNTLRTPKNIFSIVKSVFNLLISGGKQLKQFKEFSLLSDTYKELMKNQKEDFDGSVQLFIVSAESRGLGVGKALMNSLKSYMEDTKSKKIYVYTDTICNYGFYESQNFKRIGEKDIHFETMKSDLTVFLYKYGLNE